MISKAHIGIGIKRVIICILIATLFIVLGPLAFNSYADTTGTYKVSRDGVTIYTATGQRLTTCQRMNDMATVQWSIDKSVTYKYMSGKSTTLTAGNYRGLPYTQVNRDSSIPGKIQAYMDAAADGSGEVKGVDCSSATAYAIRYGTGNNTSDSNFLKGATSAYVGVSFLFDGMRTSSGSDTSLNGNTITYRNNLLKVGNYGSYSGHSTAKSTEQIVKKLVDSSYFTYGTIYDNVYAKMKPADALVKILENGNGHVMLVSGVDIVYDGKLVNPSKSKVYIIDQIAPNYGKTSTGETTSWRTGHAYTFEQLATTYVLPVTAWNSSSMTIEYDANGGQSAPSSQVKSSYQPLKLSTTKPVRTGYVFKCWKTTQNPVSLTYNPGDYYMEERADTLTAQWTPENYTISYDANGGINSPASQKKTYGTSMTITKSKPSRDGYIFAGWAFSRDATTASFASGATYNTEGSRTLYAVWKRDIAATKIVLSGTQFVYDGKTHTPSLVVSDGEKSLTQDVDYTAKYSS
ncbi:MAG: InlB B-repeat-containing protein, partial [Phocaeicola sp.]